MLSDYFGVSLSLFIVWTLLLLTPGPDFVLMLRNTLSYGYRVGLITGFGITLAISIHVLIAISGVYVLSRDSSIYALVQILGSIYLIYLGVSGLLKEKQKNILKNTKYVDSTIKKIIYFKQGFLCNIFNPKAPILMLGIFTQLIPYSASSIHKALFSLEIIVINFIVWSLFAKFIGSRFVGGKLNEHANRIGFVSNFILIFLGCYVVMYNYAI